MAKMFSNDVRGVRIPLINKLLSRISSSFSFLLFYYPYFLLVVKLEKKKLINSTFLFLCCNLSWFLSFLLKEYDEKAKKMKCYKTEIDM